MSQQKKRSFYQQRGRQEKYFLEAGLRGFFCTCNFREKDCVKETYNLLNEYADRLYGDSRTGQAGQGQPSGDAGEPGQPPVGAGEPEPAPADISDVLKREIDDLKKDSKKNAKERRFQASETGAANCVFIRTNLPRPHEITDQIFKDLLETKAQKTRYLLRILPIAATCKANLLDITNAAGPLFDEHFLKEPSTFAIIFNKRYHNKLSRDDVIKELADLVVLKNAANKADLKNPQKSIIVEIIKGICLLSVISNYYEFKKYNLFEICKDEDEKKKEVNDSNMEEDDAKRELNGTKMQGNENTRELNETKKEDNNTKLGNEATKSENESTQGKQGEPEPGGAGGNISDNK